MEKTSRVLVVDDNIELLNTFAMILQIKGFDVDTAVNGLEATILCRNNIYDVILMDISMPVMNGIDAAGEIIRIDPSTRIILMTAYAEDNIIGQATRTQTFTILHKPLQIKELVESIQQIVAAPLVLLVDDDVALCQVFSQILWKEGIRVAVANSGEEALDMVKKRPYQMAFVDFMLPNIDGVETASRFEEIDSQLKSIMITAHRERYLSMLAEDICPAGIPCLYKPLDMNRVISLAKEYCITRAM